MKKSITAVTGTSVLVALVLNAGVFLPAVSSASDVVMPEKFKVDNEDIALKDIKSNHDLQVFTLGDIALPDTLVKDLEVTKVAKADVDGNSLEKKATKRIKTLIISQEFADSYLAGNEGFARIDHLLDQGYSVFFLGNNYNKLLDLASDSPRKAYLNEDIHETSATSPSNHSASLSQNTGQNNLEYVWITKNKLGQHLLGTGYFDKNSNYSKLDVTKKIVVSAWHRQEDRDITAILPNSAVQNQLRNKLTSVVSAAALGDFSVGPGWRVWGWVQDNYTGGTYGNLTVWRTFADLWQNNDPYIAYVGQTYLQPASGAQNWGIWVGGEVDWYGAHGGEGRFFNKLYQYQPMTSPSNTTMNWTLGGTLSGTAGGSSGLSGTIGANYSVGGSTTASDISITDQTAMANQDQEVFIGYRDYYEPWYSSAPNHTYVTQTSRQDWAVIMWADAYYYGKTMTAIKNYAYFYKLGDQNSYSTAGAYQGYTLAGIYPY